MYAVKHGANHAPMNVGPTYENHDALEWFVCCSRAIHSGHCSKALLTTGKPALTVHK
jgi:hypothetical protein